MTLGKFAIFMMICSVLPGCTKPSTAPTGPIANQSVSDAGSKGSLLERVQQNGVALTGDGLVAVRQADLDALCVSESFAKAALLAQSFAAIIPGGPAAKLAQFPELNGQAVSGSAVQWRMVEGRLEGKKGEQVGLVVIQIPFAYDGDLDTVLRGASHHESVACGEDKLVPRVVVAAVARTAPKKFEVFGGTAFDGDHQVINTDSFAVARTAAVALERKHNAGASFARWSVIIASSEWADAFNGTNTAMP